MTRRSGSISRTRGLVRAVIAVMVGLLIAAALGIWQLRQGAVADTEADNHRLGVVLAEQTARTFQAVDLVLQEISEKIFVGGVDNRAALHAIFGSREFQEDLARHLHDLPQIEAFAIVDSTGHLVNETREWPVPGYSLADQPYFHYLAATPRSGPYISEPGVSRSTSAPTVFLARRLTYTDGTFLGVVVAPIRLDYFREFLANTGFSDGTSVSILRSDGVVLVHFPMTGTAPSTRIAPRSRWYDAVAAGGGKYRSANASGDAPGSYVSVHPLVIYPIVVDVIRTEAAVLERWWHQAIAISLSALSAAICLTLLLRALSRQITLIQVSEARFAAQSALLETMLEQMNQGVIMADAAGIVAVCNRRALEILDLPAEMMAAHPRSADVLEFERQRGEFMLSESTALDAAFLVTNQVTYERRRPNGTVVEIHNVPLPGGGVLRTYTDVTVRATAEQMLGTAASRDPLTGLANRGGFNIRLDAAVTAARRDTTQMALLCLDLDHFKAVNDTLGHEAGDQLLQTVAQRMRDIARSTDVVGRMGGDEFAIALPGAARTVAEKVSERLLEAMRLPYVLGQETVRIGVSIGIAGYPADGATAEQLLRNADTALYLAKAEGRNTWRNFTSADGNREQQRVQFEQDLRTAVELRHLALAYQPICDAVTREPKAFEAFLRWNHPARGPIAPGEFIPVAEQLGLIVPLGRWMLEVACAEAATWARPLHIAVNLSPAQFHDRDLLRFIQDVLARTGLSPDRLDLEVTEQLLLDDTANVVQTMQSLRAMRIRMVLDDFGTARSNLNYLRGFPFDAVKIDRSFLRALSSDPQARALVEAILAVARALGLDVVGEGVETQEQLALLCQLQCRLVQGYLLGSPAPSEATRALIRNLAAADAAAGQSTRLAVSSAAV